SSRRRHNHRLTDSAEQEALDSRGGRLEKGCSGRPRLFSGAGKGQRSAWTVDGQHALLEQPVDGVHEARGVALGITELSEDVRQRGPVRAEAADGFRQVRAEVWGDWGEDLERAPACQHELAQLGRNEPIGGSKSAGLERFE